MNISNLADLLHLQAKKEKDKVAIYNAEKEISYGLLDEYVAKTAKYFQSCNINQNDRVLHRFDDEFLLIVSMIALARMGVCLIGISKNTPQVQLDEIKELLKPKCLVSDILEDCDENDSIYLNESTLKSLKDTNYLKTDGFDANTIWQIVVGSGTTGKAKFFAISHKLELERIKISQESLNITSSDRLASLIELSYNSTKIRFFAGLYSGASFVICNKKEKNSINFYKNMRVSILYVTVFHVAVFKVADKVLQDLPVCAVSIKKGVSVSKDELVAFAKKSLGYATPKELVFLDCIPRNELGKIIRSALEEKVIESLLQKKTDITTLRNIETLKLEIVIDKTLNFTQLNRWFEEVFNLELPLVNLQKPLISLSQYALKFATFLFQSCHIPLFEDAKIKSIQNDTLQKNKFIIEISYEYIDFIPLEYFLSIISHSFEYGMWMTSNTLSIDKQNILLNKIVESTINPILSKMPHGKSRIHILKEAFKKKIPFLHLSDGMYQLGWGSNSVKIDRSIIGSDSAIGSKLSGNKANSANILGLLGLPAPVHKIATQESEALRLAKDLKYPLVVKPVDLDRGEGVSVNLEEDKALIAAFNKALALSKSKQILIEKQVAGVCHRLFIVKEKLLYAVKRLPIGVFCDGVSTIKELIYQANKKESSKLPWDDTKKYFYDDAKALASIKKAGFSIDSIPHKNSFVPLREIESTQWGGIDEDVSHVVHPENFKIAIQAATVFGLSVCGVDIIATDISKPWYETGAIINEVNFAPLLGGGAISKEHIGEFLDLILESNGLIPFELYDSKALSLKRFENLIASGSNCYHVSQQSILNNKFELIFFDTKYSIEQKIKALLLNPKVDALIVYKEN